MALLESLMLCHAWKQPQMLLLKYRTVLIKFAILWCGKRAKNRKTNIYYYEVIDVVPEIVVKIIGNVTIKHLFFSCFYSRFWKLVFRFLSFSEFKKKKKRKEICFHYTDLFLVDTKHNPKECYIWKIHYTATEYYTRRVSHFIWRNLVFYVTWGSPA